MFAQQNALDFTLTTEVMSDQHQDEKHPTQAC